MEKNKFGVLVPIILNPLPDCTIFLFNPKPPSTGFFMNHDLAICLSVVFDHIRYKGEKEIRQLYFKSDGTAEL